MTNNNIDYEKAIETLNNVYPPACGFVTDEHTTQKTLCSQNNLIIELLIRINQKLDHINSILKPNIQPDTLFTETLATINKNLETLALNKKIVLKTSNQTLAVWQDPQTLFKRDK